MKKYIALIFIACWCSVLHTVAQTYSLSQLRAWSSTEAVGDLDKDGINDLVIIATPDFKENFIVEDGDTIDANLDINDRGVLKVGLEYFASAGSYGSSNISYVYRFQNGDFYLIGEDNKSFMRNTGEAETYSYNYLTHKRQIVRYNMFDDKVKPRETWSNIPKKPLKKLGSFIMGDS